MKESFVNLLRIFDEILHNYEKKMRQVCELSKAYIYLFLTHSDVEYSLWLTAEIGCR